MKCKYYKIRTKKGVKYGYELNPKSWTVYK